MYFNDLFGRWIEFSNYQRKVACMNRLRICPGIYFFFLLEHIYACMHTNIAMSKRLPRSMANRGLKSVYELFGVS